MLTLGQRAALLIYCADHPVAVCSRCSELVSIAEAATDAFMNHLDYCPRCTADLTTSLRKHLDECTWIRAQEIRERAQATRQHAREIDKQSAQLRDRAELLAAEAEAELERARRVKRGQSPDDGTTTR
jgi:hypothetical protein